MIQMTNVEVTYNPFTVETTITVDGKVSHGRWSKYHNTRLQQWLEELFPLLVEECNDNLNVLFRGTQLDFEDVKIAADEYMQKNSNIQIMLDKPIISANAEPRLEDLKQLFHTLQTECPFEDLRSPEIKEKFDDAMSTKFKVSVIATMSSGKSTLINAMLGQELMPAKNEACTATIASIEDVDSMNDFEAVCLDKVGNVIAKANPLTAAEMSEYNENPDVSWIQIKGNIPFVTSQNMQLVLEDTPGPNNSRNEEHKKHTMKVIKEKSMPMVLYILNATQIATNDDAYLLSVVANAMKVGGKQSKDRFIFAVNKADAIDADKESVDTILDNVRKYLEEHGIENPNVYPVSAEIAKVIRLKGNGQKLSRTQTMKLPAYIAQLNEFDDMHFETYAPLSIQARKIFTEDVKQLQAEHDEANEALIHTGVPAIEMAIDEYLRKYALTNKVESAVNTFKKKIEEKQIMGNLMDSLAQDDAARQKMQEQAVKIEKLLRDGNNKDAFMRRLSQSQREVERDITAKAKDIFSHFNRLIDSQIDIQGNSKLSLDDASRLIYQLRQFSKQIESDLQTDLEEMVEETVGETAKASLQEYEKSFRNLLDGQRVQGLALNTTFDVMSSSMPSASDLIHEYRQEKRWSERVKVGTRWVENENKKWWKPWTWFDDSGHNEDVYETRTHSEEFIYGSALINEYVSPLSENIADNIEQGKRQATAQARQFQTFFTNKMDEIDRKLQENADKLRAISESRETLSRQIESNKQKMAWLKEFTDKLDETLSV